MLISDWLTPDQSKRYLILVRFNFTRQQSLKQLAWQILHLERLWLVY